MVDIKGKPLAYIVDDDADIREVVRLAMVFEGWDARVAGDGQEALGMLREKLPNLLIIDLMMPGMSGMELLRNLLSHGGGAEELPVLMISAVREGAKLVEDFRELPFARKQFIHKPFNNDEMLKAVRALVPGDFRAKTETPKPAPPKPAPQTLRTAPQATHIRGYKMLVVDDEPDICFVMKAHLGQYHSIRTASNGIEGLEALDEFEPDFVLTDVNMPLMNGLQFAESIRRHPRLGATPIFFFTGESDASLPRKSYDVGGNLFLRKPIDVEQLLKFIDHFIQETGLRPGEHPAAVKPKPKPAAAAPAKPAAPAPAKAPGAVRILTVSQSPEDRLLLAPVLAKIPAVETLWTDDPFSAIGNLTRWDPDVVLYNVRHPRMEGVEFGQTLTLKRIDQRPLICFIGSSFSPLEVDYSRRNFAYDPITVNASERLQGRLTALIDAARPRIKAKRMEVVEIQKEESARIKAMQEESDRKRRQQEALRGRYDQLQKFIDSHFK
ncbi:response regulator [bacterium]|nr:response regulator [bacterium]